MSIIPMILIGYVQYLCIVNVDSYCATGRMLDFKRSSILIVAFAFILASYNYIGVYIQFLYLGSCLILNASFKKKLNQNILISTLSCSILILIDHLISFLFYFNQIGILDILRVEELTPFAIAIRLVLYILFSCIAAYYFRKILVFLETKVKLSTIAEWIGTSCVVALYVILCIIIFSATAEGNHLTTILLNSFFITIYFVFTIVLLITMYFYMKKRSEDMLKEKEKQNLKEYTNYLESNYNELRKFRHDYQNILTSLESFIEEDDFESLKEYYYQSIQSTQRLLQKNEFKLSEISQLKVTEIKSIVASKLLQSQQLGIDTVLEIKEPIEEIKMDAVTLIRCLGIILDNAIEECKDQSGSFIRMAIIKEEHGLSFVVQNSIKENHPKLFEMNRTGFSTKGDNRGLGLSNLKEMIDYEANATLETIIEKNTFTQKIEIAN